MLLEVFDLLVEFVILLTLTSYFLLCFFFVLLKKVRRHKLFGPNFYRLSDLFLGSFKGNTNLTLPSALSN